MTCRTTRRRVRRGRSVSVGQRRQSHCCQCEPAGSPRRFAPNAGLGAAFSGHGRASCPPHVDAHDSPEAACRRCGKHVEDVAGLGRGAQARQLEAACAVFGAVPDGGQKVLDGMNARWNAARHPLLVPGAQREGVVACEAVPGGAAMAGPALQCRRASRWPRRCIGGLSSSWALFAPEGEEQGASCTP